jgi:hypothetical protein
MHIVLEGPHRRAATENCQSKRWNITAKTIWDKYKTALNAQLSEWQVQMEEGGDQMLE